MFIAPVLAASLLATGGQATAAKPTAPPNFALAPAMLRTYHQLQADLLAAADKMPDADFEFRATPDVRPFRQLVVHVALAQFGACAYLKGETSPRRDEKESTARSKADTIALLKASTAYCDPALDALTDANLTEMFKTARGTPVSKGFVLANTNDHGNEMYGTMAVYLRLKGIVPPTTEREKTMAHGG